MYNAMYVSYLIPCLNGFPVEVDVYFIVKRPGSRVVFLWLSALWPPFLIYHYAQIHYSKSVMFN